jgi:predicted phage terminase large subunit-like protein
MAGHRAGFVGQGADLLIIDDPYASPQDALSETIRESTWMFWEQSAKVRLNDDTNVVVMFHRYHEDDIAGRLWAQGGWEMLRYAAVADDDPQWPDPLGRREGEKLSPRMSDAFLAEQQKSSYVWLGQFQGRPLPLGGGMLKRNWFKSVAPESVPPLDLCVFGVDLAVSAKTTADYTVAFPLGVSANQDYYLFRPARGQWEPHDARREIINRVRTFKQAAQVGVESVAALSGYVTELRREDGLRGHSVVDVPRYSDKVALAATWSPIASQGRFYLVDDGTGWTEAFLREAEGFPLGKNDDQIDAVGIAMHLLRNTWAVQTDDEAHADFWSRD